MSDKLRNILALALRPETGSGEATAAFAAARRLAAKDGIDKAFESRTEVKTKTVYKDRVVYKDRIVYRPVTFPSDAETWNYKLTVPPAYHHNTIEHMFQIAYRYGIWIDVRSCKPRNGKIAESTIFELTLHGKRELIDLFDSRMDRFVDELRKSGYMHSADAQVLKEPARSFFVRMIKKMAEAL